MSLPAHDREETHEQPLSPDAGHLHVETRPPMRQGMRRLRWAIAITGVILVVEVIGGLLTNSLALLSDAGHMFTHVFALGISYFAIVLSGRPANPQKTFGYFRAEVLAAFVNGILILGITALIFYEAATRLIEPEHVKGTGMLVVAVVGLIANGASFALLAGVRGHDLNLKSAFIHVVYDAVSSVAVVACALVMGLTGFVRLDPIVSVGIGLVIVLWCFDLLKESVNILLEATPKDVDIDRIHSEVESIPRVRAIHDIHVWQITTDIYVMTAHLAVEDMPVSEAEETVAQVNHVLREHHKIGHTTLQIEFATAEGTENESAPREHGPAE